MHKETDLTKRKRDPKKGIYIPKEKTKRHLKSISTPFPKHHRKTIEIIQNQLLTEYNIKISLTSLISYILDDSLPSSSNSPQFRIYLKKLVKKINDSTENNADHQFPD